MISVLRYAWHGSFLPPYLLEKLICAAGRPSENQAWRQVVEISASDVRVAKTGRTAIH